MARNAGAFALARTGATQTAVAKACGVSIPTAHDWFNGNKKPGPVNRKRLREVYGVGEDLFDQIAKPTRARTAPLESKRIPIGDVATAAGGAFAMARELEQMAQKQMADLRTDTNSTPLERAKVMASLSTTINTLAKMTGQYDLGRRMLRLPIWKQIERELREALSPFPEAASAVAERFARLEEQERAG